MSAPAPRTVHTPFTCEPLPASPTLPTSAVVQAPCASESRGWNSEATAMAAIRLRLASIESLRAAARAATDVPIEAAAQTVALNTNRSGPRRITIGACVGAYEVSHVPWLSAE